MVTRRIPFVLVTLVAFGCSEGAVAPTDAPALQARVGRVLHRVTVGSPDAALYGPGGDANFSLHALQGTDGVSGEWEDASGHFPGFDGVAIHVHATCLKVVGNQAWVSGVITRSTVPFFPPGTDAVTTVVDNGTSAKDPPDQISFSWFGLGTDCNAMPDLPLLDAPKGQAVVVQ